MTLLTKSAAVLLGIAALSFAAQAGANDVKELQGKAIPAFTMTTIDGKTVSSNSLKGKPYVLDFWATWCGPCKKATPFMQSLYSEFGSKGLVVVGANGLEDTKGAGPASSYAKEHKLGYVMTHSNDALMQKWGVTGVPTIMFVDKTGKVRKVYVGFADSLKAEMKALVADMVAGK
ncbi:MAG: TlpA family protein disulfide reductase [Fimbriimonadaceae bacterium]|nr:TlpA family protein disulfide reductase [Fimbriimonadaceae bacterium]QYK55353.1 MAG: TlpA family protein disulfide reductase [Fimbriimonadaceae bacterium]